MAALVGKWKCTDKGEHIDDILKAYGIADEEKRNAIKAAEPTWELSQDGSKFTTTMTSPVGNRSDTWEAGVEFDCKNIKGEDMKSTYTVEGDNVLVENSTAGAVTANIRREVDGNVLTLTVKVGDVSNVSKWEKV